LIAAPPRAVTDSGALFLAPGRIAVTLAGIASSLHKERPLPMDVVENNFDPVREPSLSRRLALLGVVVGVMAVFPVYALLLGLNLTVTVFVLAPGAVAGLSAIVGIEVALRWAYRLRRRHTYPHDL